MNVYVYQAALLCEDCARATRERINPKYDNMNDSDNSDEWPQGPYSDGGGEADTPQHCDHCGLFLENPLTSDGEAYVKEQWAEYHAPPRDRSMEAWREYYAYLFE